MIIRTVVKTLREEAVIWKLRESGYNAGVYIEGKESSLFKNVFYILFTFLPILTFLLGLFIASKGWQIGFYITGISFLYFLVDTRTAYFNSRFDDLLYKRYVLNFINNGIVFLVFDFRANRWINHYFVAFDRIVKISLAYHKLEVLTKDGNRQVFSTRDWQHTPSFGIDVGSRQNISEDMMWQKINLERLPQFLAVINGTISTQIELVTVSNKRIKGNLLFLGVIILFIGYIVYLERAPEVIHGVTYLSTFEQMDYYSNLSGSVRDNRWFYPTMSNSVIRSIYGLNGLRRILNISSDTASRDALKGPYLILKTRRITRKNPYEFGFVAMLNGVDDSTFNTVIIADEFEVDRASYGGRGNAVFTGHRYAVMLYYFDAISKKLVFIDAVNTASQLPRTSRSYVSERVSGNDLLTKIAEGIEGITDETISTSTEFYFP